MWIFLSMVIVLGGTLLPGPAPAQSAAALPAGWNAERALELVRRAQQRRAESVADTGLVNYRASARAYVYFYLDRQDTRERNLVKTDQLALDVFWQAPDQVKQRIVGWRDAKALPTNIRYHLDHLSVVQENFGDEIRLGDGDEVRGVPHPAAPGAESFYEYRLADSLTLRLPGAEEPVRVYELEVRPRDPSRPGLVGAIFVDRRSGDLVRMDFTFTAAAYVDAYLDYINISLDNGLWRGRYWLPNQQRIEIRRRIPQLDIPAGSVIRANMRVFGYRFNERLPPGTFLGPTVTALPEAQREAFAFEEPLDAELREEGLGTRAELEEIRRLAARLAREEVLAPATGLRLRIPRASDLARYNRAEGLTLGAGLGLTPSPGLRLGLVGGYAFGAEHPTARATLAGALGSARLATTLYLNRPRQLGAGPAASGAVNSLSALLAARDFQDLYYADGAEVELRSALGSAWSIAAGLRAESQGSAGLAADFSAFGDFRPVHPVDELELLGAGLALERAAPAEAGAGWSLSLAAEAGWMRADGPPLCAPDGPCAVYYDRAGFLKPRVEVGWHRRWTQRDALLEAEAALGGAFGRIPRQELYLLGGRGTLPGYGFRAYGGDRFATLSATASAALWRPWLRGRLLGALGWAAVGDAGTLALDAWGARPTGGLKPSLGAGVGVFYDILRLDLARGLGPEGGWELIIEAAPSFWDFL